MTCPRILVGRIWHEGHAFNPILTERADMAMVLGEAMLAEARASTTALTGIVLEADRRGFVLVPSIAAWARPGGPIAQDVFDEIAGALIERAGQGGFDAICLELHGATTAQHLTDTEGALLACLRAIVGPDLPIAVALDLHGHITPQMVEAATIMTGYRTNPHADMVETGARAMALLAHVLETGQRPHATLLRVPFLTRGADETSHGPLVAICSEADRWRAKPGLIELSIFNTHPFIDGEGLGQKVLAYDDGSGVAKAACRAIGQSLWDSRRDFTETLPDVVSVLAQAGKSARPFVLGDQGDRVLGAGPGDSVEIARVALVRFPDLKVVSPVHDPEAVRDAMAAGEGAVLRLAVGGGTTPGLSPLEAEWRVERLLQARFTNKGPYMAGVATDLGDSAVLACGNLRLIATSRAPNVHDPAFFEAAGLPVAQQQVLVAKSGNHYKLSFAGLAETITVDTPGLTAFRLHDLPYRHARPVWPCDAFDWQG
ncbi:MAG: M81 family metallopeptidase [Bosea sp. (in: a-proteobacteria)]